MKKTYCLICSHSDFKTVVNSRDLTVMACKNCDMYMVPQKKKKAKKVGEYFKNYNLGKYVRYYEGFRKENYKNNWKQIRKWKRSGKSLDFGSSFGWFLEVAPKSWKVYGVEPADVAVDYCKNKGLNVIRGSENKVSKFKTSFDLISLWNVIEHLPDPVKTLKHLSQTMNENSIFAIAFPNRYGFYNQLAYYAYRISFGSFVKPLYVLFQADNPLPHLYHYRVKDIEKLLHKVGFTIIKSEPQKIIDAKNLWKREELQSSIFLKFIGVPTLIVLDFILDAIHFNQDEMVIYAKKLKVVNSR